MKFKKVLDRLANRHSIGTVFDDFLQMSICAFSLGKMEHEYLSAIKKYDPEETKLFGDALGALVLDYDSKCLEDGSWDDILGCYFEMINSSSQASRAGQFFTPPALCNIMAQMVAPEVVVEDKITVNDCACGSGRNLIAHSRLNTLNRFKTFYVAQDLDYRCVKMCVLNFIMMGMSGVVIHMDTLSLKIFKGFRIWLPETGLFIRPLSEKECEQYVYSSNTEIKESSIKTTGAQTLLF